VILRDVASDDDDDVHRLREAADLLVRQWVGLTTGSPRSKGGDQVAGCTAGRGAL
jgi:hypothetical protein